MKRIALLLFLCMCAGPVGTGSAAQTHVHATVDRTAVTVGESLQMEVVIQNGKGEVDVSGIDGFKVLSSGTRSSVQIINGAMSQEQRHAYLLIPQRSGRITIPPLAVTVDGTRYATEPIVITVAKTPAAAPHDREAWVTAKVSTPSPYRGQQFTYTFTLINRVQIDGAKFQPPEFDGFSSTEIKERRSYRKIINGREHMVTEVYFILTPLVSGPHTIAPAVLQAGIVKQNRGGRRSPFDDFFNRGTIEQRVLQTEAVDIMVAPLPSVPSGTDFSGLIGTFELRATLEKTEMAVGDSATVAVTISGSGNLMDADAPEIEIPAAFKQYGDTPQVEISADARGFHGSKTFRTALVPTRPGSFTFAPVALVYFDPEQAAYQTVTAAIPSVTVRPPTDPSKPPMLVTPQQPAQVKKRVAFTGRDILPPKESLAAIAPHTKLSGTILFVMLLVPAAGFLATVTIQRLRHRESDPVSMMAARAREAIKRARHASPDAVCDDLYRALTDAILASVGRTGETLTWKEARTLLHNGKTPALADTAAALLEKIESCRFSGQAENRQALTQLRQQTQDMVRKLLR